MNTYGPLQDARASERAAYYTLLRITEVEGKCWDDYVDVEKPPVIVLDPRAGHGPGIGRPKRDSEVGIAIAEGHPVYFVIFSPEPSPDQTLEHVLFALRHFVYEVSARHDGSTPVRLSPTNQGENPCLHRSSRHSTHGRQHKRTI